MTARRKPSYALAGFALILLALLLIVSCSNGDSGLTRAEVEEIVRAEMPESTAPPKSDPGLTEAEVERIVESALAEIEQPQAGLTAAEAERIARGVVASIPSRSSPAEYTKFFVDNALSRYESEGLDATLAHYNRGESVDGQWYVFIIDERDLVIGHPDPGRLGLDLNDWVGTDVNGYNFGPEMLSATEDGKWVSYVYGNPESGNVGSGDFGDLELKNVWVVKRDGLLFASGWYIDADEFTQLLVNTAVEKFLSGGLEETVAYFASPGSALAGLEAAVDYYNTAETVDGAWAAFITDPDGRFVAHSDPSLIGLDGRELLGEEITEVSRGGNWVTTDSQRIWAAGNDGWVFGAGWHRDGSGN